MRNKANRGAGKSAIVASEQQQIVSDAGGGAVEQPTADATASPETGGKEQAKPEVPKRTAEQEQAWIAERVNGLKDEKLKAAIANGDVVCSIREVVITAKSSPTGVEARREYLGMDAMNAAGLSAMNGGRIRPAKAKPATGKDERTAEEKLYGACDWHNYGYDLDVRQQIRGELMGTLEGPEKAVATIVKGLRSLDMGDEEIRTQIMASPKFSGFPNISEVIDGALARK